MATTSLAKVMWGESARFAKLPAIHASDQICAQSILAAQVILTPVLVVFRKHGSLQHGVQNIFPNIAHWC